MAAIRSHGNQLRAKMVSNTYATGAAFMSCNPAPSGTLSGTYKEYFGVAHRVRELSLPSETMDEKLVSKVNSRGFCTFSDSAQVVEIDDIERRKLLEC
jgi:hypothetical protein